MSSEHTLLELKKLIPAKTAEETEKEYSREASSPERARGVVEGETVPTEVSDVEKELRAIEVLKSLFATQKEGATPRK